MLLNCGVGGDSWESLGLQGDPTSPSHRRSVLNIHWKDWYWSWNSNTLATWCKLPTHWKRPWCWERLKAGGKGDDRGWDGWMASLTQWTWVWVNSESWWWTGRPGVLQPMGSQSRTCWATALNWWSKQQCSHGKKKGAGIPVSWLVPGNPGHTVGIWAKGVPCAVENKIQWHTNNLSILANYWITGILE